MVYHWGYSHTHTPLFSSYDIYIYIYIHLCFQIMIYIYIYICVCVHLYNEMLQVLSRKHNLKHQIFFLHQCKKLNLTPKGLQFQIPKNLAASTNGKVLTRKVNTNILDLSISEINKKWNCTENKIWACRLKIESYDLGKVWLQNTETWLNKIARRKNIPVRSRLTQKFLRLKHEKKMLKNQLNKIKEERISNAI